MAVRTIPIDSLDDPRVEFFRDVRDRDLRGREKLFMAESELVLRRLLRTPHRLKALFLSPKKLRRLEDALEVLQADVPVYVADVDLMTRIAGFNVHRGVLAAGVRPHEDELSIDGVLGHLQGAERLRFVIAEGLTNVDNMGGIFRNAAAYGMDAVVLDPRCCDPLYRKAIRVSMGHTLSVRWAICRNWPGDLLRLKEQWGITLIGAEVTEEGRPLWEMPRDPRVGLLFGSEGHGLSAEALRACDVVCQIPMAGDVPSLNVATTSAVFMYELTRGGA